MSNIFSCIHKDTILGIRVLVIFMALFKLVLLYWHGPVFLPDSGGYVEFAETILLSTEWTGQVDIYHPHIQTTAIRLFGYPYILSAAMALFGDYWSWVVVALQIALSSAASFALYRLANALTALAWPGLLVAFAHGTGLGAVLDLCILTDSLNSSLLIVIACSAGVGIIESRAPSVAKVLGLGMLLGIAFFIREAGQVTQWLYVPLFGVWFLRSREGWLRPIMMLALFLMPINLSIHIVKDWNASRSGERFVTTAAQTTPFLPTVLLWQKGLPVFDFDSRFEGLTLKSGAHFFENILTINYHLISEKDLSAVEVGGLAYQVYFSAWRQYPVEMVGLTLREIMNTASLVYFMPFHTAMKYQAWARGERSIANALPMDGLRRAMEEPTLFLPFILITLGRLLTLSMGALFAIGVPLMVLKHWKNQRSISAVNIALSLLWILTIGFISAYALLHLEARYILPVDMFIVTGALCVMLQWKKTPVNKASLLS